MSTCDVLKILDGTKELIDFSVRSSLIVSIFHSSHETGALLIERPADIEEGDIKFSECNFITCCTYNIRLIYEW